MLSCRYEGAIPDAWSPGCRLTTQEVQYLLVLHKSGASGSKELLGFAALAVRCLTVEGESRAKML